MGLRTSAYGPLAASIWFFWRLAKHQSWIASPNPDTASAGKNHSRFACHASKTPAATKSGMRRRTSQRRTAAWLKSR